MVVIGCLIVAVVKSPETAMPLDESVKTVPRREREFHLRYSVTIGSLPEGRVQVWVPVPRSTSNQIVKLIHEEMPAPAATSSDPDYGNQILSFEISRNTSDRISFVRTYAVHRHEVRALLPNRLGERLSHAERSRFLAANAKVPISGRPLKLLEGLKLPEDRLSLARTIYDRVDSHVRYDKSVPGYGTGDVVWVCDSRTGNCTDFHSLFISLARSQKIPARFEIGFPVPQSDSGSIGGYHCWASFFTPSHGWVPVDISEADKHPAMKDYYFGNLTADRVLFTIGRDIELVPKQTGPPLNYFVYPYVEVNNHAWPQQHVRVDVSYEEIRFGPGRSDCVD